MMEPKRCTHRTFWALAGGRVLWCYGCGAIRLMADGAPGSIWQRPVGVGEPNPWARFAERSARHHEPKALTGAEAKA